MDIRTDHDGINVIAQIIILIHIERKRLKESAFSDNKKLLKLYELLERKVSRAIDMGIDKKLINPLDIKGTDLPLIVLSSHSNNLISWLIRLRTKASYNHIMWMIEPGKVATQGWLFKSIPIVRYMGKWKKLKFWKIKNLTYVQHKLITELIIRDLAKPWWKRRYDFLGIFGQLIGLKWINVPWIDYCSEKSTDPLRKIMEGIPAHPSPKDLNDLFKSRPDDFEVYGYWFFD